MVTRSFDNTINGLDITARILGLNINGSKTIAVYGDMNGLIYERIQMETPSAASFLEGFDVICQLADKLLKVCRAQRLRSPEVISVAISGPVDLTRGMVFSPPDLPQWDDAPLAGRLMVRYNLPVLIEHRSTASALAEFYFGAGTGINDLILMDLEPVVSTGMIIKGEAYHGANDAAGEIGRMRFSDEGPAGLGEPGSLTGFASGPGMAELASLRYPEQWPTPPPPYELVRDVNAGDPAALSIIEVSADYLGKALLWLIFSLDPEMVIFGHPGDVLGEALLSPLRDAVLRYGGAEARQLPLLAVSKLAAKLDDTAALMAVIDRFKRRAQA